MKELKFRTLQTPYGAMYISETSRSESGVLTVEYFRANKERIPIVSPQAGVMREDTYLHLIGEKSEKMNKAPKEPKGKASKDGRVSDVKKSADLPQGRDVTKAEKEAINVKVDELDLQDDEIPNHIKGRAKELIGKIKGEAVYERFSIVDKLILDEATDDATYAWRVILGALNALGLDQEEIARFQGLLGDDYVTADGIPTRESKQISFQDLKKTLVREKSDADIDVNAVDQLKTGSVHTAPKQKNEVYPRMSEDDMDKKLEAIPNASADKIEALGYNTQIRVIRIKNKVVQKVIPTIVVDTSSSAGAVYAKIKTPDEEQPTIKIIDSAGSVKLQRGRKSRVYYYLEYDDAEEDKTVFNFVGTKRKSRNDQST